ncbi:GNAT family N-acetyltransferase [Roseibium aggregatum]|nr:GNAT family N-acetyltransferase [Roseibium aggregatum]
MQNFVCRVLAPEDSEAWQKLRLEGARDFPSGFLVTYEETAAARRDHCRKILAGGSFRGVFTEENLVGLCGYRPQQLKRTQHRGVIGPFFVTRSYQGSGAAKVLMAGVIEEAKSNGLAQLELFVDTENLRAMAFYERQGFERVATHYDSVRVDGESRNDHLFTLRL